MAFDLSELTQWGINTVSAVAGGIGAMVAALHAEVDHRLERVVYFLVGLSCALFLPAVTLRLSGLPQDPSMLGALGFVYGYFGMSLLDAVSAIIRAVKKADYKTAIEGWIKKDSWFKKNDSLKKKG